MSSGTVPRPLDLGMISIRQDIQVSRTGSAPTSPKTSVVSSGSSTGKQTYPRKQKYVRVTNICSLSTGPSGPTPSTPQTQPLNLASQRPSHHNVELLRGITGGGGVNSKSLPNIPSAMVRKDKGVGRKSPPTSAASGATKQMLVRRSKSSAILPLRKHLIGESVL